MKKIFMYVVIMCVAFLTFAPQGMAVSNAKATKELQQIKKYAKKGETPRSKGLKAHSTYAAIVKKLGKKKKEEASYYYEVKQYKFSNGVRFEFQGKPKKNSAQWIIDQKKKTYSVGSDLTNKPMTYKQIKKVFGKTDDFIYSGRTYEHTISYKTGKYRIYFTTKPGNGQGYKKKLTDSTQFIRYQVQ